MGACTAVVGVLLAKGFGPWATTGMCLATVAVGIGLRLAKRLRG